MEQIVNPTTNRLINVNGRTYNELIKYGEYNEEYLDSLPKITTSNYNMEEIQFTGIDDTDVNILSYLDDYLLIQVCQTNKRLNNLCKKYLSNRINRYLNQEEKKFEKMKYKIGMAITADKDKKGSSRQAIKKYLAANYNIKPNDPLINSTIKILLNRTSGERLIKNKHYPGHYKLSSDFKNALMDLNK